MKDLLILGTGVHALEMIEIVERVNRAAPTWNLIGLITPDAKLIGKTLNQVPVVGLPGDWNRYPQANLIPSLADLRAIGDVPLERCASLIDPTAFISRTAVIGRGCVFYPHTFVGFNARVEDFVFCLTGSVINHDDVIGERTAITSGVMLAGSVTVGPDCYLGQACTIRQLLTIGRHSFIGMGAVVVKNVEPDCVMAGNPARKIKDNTFFL
jgi:sugar O-acyltransferase (sialic acid O-acetyltransferase NeuD family)